MIRLHSNCHCDVGALAEHGRLCTPVHTRVHRHRPHFGRIGRRSAAPAMRMAAEITPLWRSMDGRGDEQLSSHSGSPRVLRPVGHGVPVAQAAALSCLAKPRFRLSWRTAARGSRPHDAIRRWAAISSLPGRALPGRALPGRAWAGRAWPVAERAAVPREATLAGCAAGGAGRTGVPDVAICRTTGCPAATSSLAAVTPAASCSR